MIEPMQRPVESEETEDELKQRVKDSIDAIATSYLKDEEFVRDLQLKVARRNENYWRNHQDIWWDAEAKDWRNLSDAGQFLDDIDEDESVLDRRYVNIYKAHGQSIIAALSNGVPATRFLPEDGNNVNDIYSAEAYSKLAGYLRKNNKAKNLVIQILVTLFNEPFAAIHNYVIKDEKFGTYPKPENGFFKNKTVRSICSACGEVLEEDNLPAEVVEEDYIPEDGTNLQGQPTECPNCQTITLPVEESEESVEEGIVGYTDSPKSKLYQDCYGITNVTIPAYAKSLEECPFLALDIDISKALAIELFDLDKEPQDSDDTDIMYRWARTNIDYRDQKPRYTCSVRRVWLRNWALNRIEDEDIRAEIKALFPDGCLVTYLNSELIQIESENLDEHWTISKDPQYKFIAGDAIGTAIVPLQDAKNEIFNLTQDTIAHGISETFVESGILDLDQYGRQQARPGNITATLTAGQKSLQESFFQTKPANLSSEVAGFDEKIEKDTQFVSGAYPSIYGGSMQNSGGTLGEYQESRNQALQRLQLVWTLLCNTWSEMEFKSIKDFVANVDYDIQDVNQSGQGYAVTWIKRAQLTGSVVGLEPEANEAFPISWAQKKSVIDSLLQMKDEFINSILSHPENIDDMATAYGMGGLYIPGSDDRNKQLAEIAMLLQGGPQESMNPMGQPMMIPSVPTEPDVDNAGIHIESCRSWLVSETGQAAKTENQQGYLNVLAHLKMHQMDEQLKMQQQMQAAAPNGNIQGPPAQEGAPQ